MIALARRVLAIPAMFNAYQAAVGANHAKSVFVNEWIRPIQGDSLLDIGCGTGAIIPFLPTDTHVTGVDIDAAYVATARKSHGKRARFILGDACDPSVDLGDNYDVAYAFGVLHHIPDMLASSLISGAIKRLRPGGRFVSIDPTLVLGQGAVSRYIVKSDRGEHVRSPEQIRAVFGATDPTLTVRTDLLRIPFAQVVAVAIKG